MSDDTQTTAGATPAKPKKGLLIGAIAGGAVAGLAAGAFALAPALSAKPTDVTADSAAVAKPAPPAPATAPTVLTNLVVNPSESRGARFLLVSVGFEFKPALTAEEFTVRETEVRDRILSLLATKTVDLLADPLSRDGLRAEISATVDSIVGAGRTKRVLFPQFVIQ